MALKNKEIDKLFDAVELYFDSYCLPSLITAFMACDDTIEGEIAAIKAELTEAKQRLNNERKHGEDLADVNGQLASENGNLKARLTLFEHSRITWRARAQHAEKEVEDLNKKISELEEENANLRVTPPDAKAIENLEKSNSILRRDNEILWSKLEEVELDISKRPWHGDANAMTSTWTCCESLTETIEFQNKKIEKLKLLLSKERKHGEDLANTNSQLASKIEALKKANSALRRDNEILWSQLEEVEEELDEKIKEKVDLSYGHEFKFGDKVFVPWSCDPYMYIKPAQLYNPRTNKLVYVGKTQHLKWFGERFEIK